MSNEETNLGTGKPGIDSLSKIPGSSATRGAGQFKNVGAIRKAGFLSVKKWIIKRRQSIELARKQGWKKYWVCLRGTALLFHSVVDKSDIQVDNEQTYTTNLLTWIQANCTSQPGLVASIMREFADFNNPEAGIDPNNVLTTDQLAQCYIEREPRHLIMIEGAIAQPIPEHPKRDFVFCLSTIFGDAYLFQSSCQLESENWILSVHNACAASVARDLTRDEAMKLFETKIRYLELEAEKKLLLRQRLESRLALMSSLSHVNSIANQSNTSFHHPKHELDKSSMDDQSNKKVTMRALLRRLNQQLLALDVHIEKVHCEIYQLRCYLTSCGNQSLFYRSGFAENKTRASNSLSPSLLSLDLPHPRSLLQFVSKPTKLLLIKLGVFTVSSFHAFVHARQGGLDATLQKSHPDIQGQFTENSVKLRLRSQSTSESMDKVQNVELENVTEKLLDLANLRIVPVKLTRKLFEQICGTDCNIADNLDVILTADSDGIYSVSDRGEFILIEMKLHSSSSSLSIIKQVLRIVNPDLKSFEMLNYYLRLNLSSDAKSINEVSSSDGQRNSSTQYEVKRGETLKDWSNYECLELMEKMIFRAELTRSRLDEDSAPFGISIGAQLFADNHESLLNVYCSYIEWGSVADKSGLKDDDELLMINGVPVMDLDLMFVECIIQDESKLRLVVRSSRNECASNAILLDKFNWGSPDKGPDSDDDENHHREDRKNVNPRVQLLGTNIHSSSQIISDEYISSLVCPPPPTKSNAFLRTDSTLLRQKSDLTADSSMNGTKTKVNKEYPTERDCDQTTKNPNGKKSSELVTKIMSRSQIDLVDSEDAIECRRSSETKHVDEILPVSDSLDISPAQFGENSTANSPCLECHEPDNSRQLQKVDGLGDSIKKSSLNSIERLRRSILELFETEYAYIKHLETISEHYMSPLEDVSYLNIPNLKQLDRAIKELLAFQREFLSKLISRAFDTGSNMVHLKLVTSNFEQLSGIIHQLDSYRKLNDYDDLLNAIAKTFIDESENFKIYAVYCANYSGLQRILHPNNLHPAFSHSVFGNPLDTFITSNIIQSGTLNSVMNNTQQYRMPFTNTFMPKTSTNVNNESDLKLKQINQFLSHLDSSSPSASLSLAKSSSDSEQTLSGSSNKSKLFRQTGQQVSRNQHKSVHQQNFESYLIKPIQRIVKYPILLKSIASSAQSTAEDELHKGLQSAMKQMESITSHVNDTQRLHDEYGTMFEQIERQYCTDGQKFDQLSKINPPPNPYLSHKPQINLNVEQLLYFGPVDWLNINEYTSKLKKGINLTQVLFVFNTCVVFICKELILKSAKSIKLPMSNTCHNSNLNNSSGAETGSVAIAKASQKSNTDFSEVIRYQSVIPVSEVQVRSVPVSSQGTSVKSSRLLPSDGSSYKWELFRCSSVNSNSSLLTKSNKKNATGKVYLLANESNDARNAFLRKIRFIIRESVRNMSLPLARSPSSKSLTPKKLSSPSSSGGTHTNNSSCSHSTSLSPVRTDRDNATETQDCVQCDYVDGRVDSTNYTTSIEVNN